MSYRLLSIEDANLVDRHLTGMKTAEQKDQLANLVLESRAQQPPLTITAPDGSQIPVDPENAVRIGLRASETNVDL